MTTPDERQALIKCASDPRLTEHGAAYMHNLIIHLLAIIEADARELEALRAERDAIKEDYFKYQDYSGRRADRLIQQAVDAEARADALAKELAAITNQCAEAEITANEQDLRAMKAEAELEQLKAALGGFRALDVGDMSRDHGNCGIYENGRGDRFDERCDFCRHVDKLLDRKI